MCTDNQNTTRKSTRRGVANFVAIGTAVAGIVAVAAMARSTGGHSGGTDHVIPCMIIVFFLLALAIANFNMCLKTCDSVFDSECNLACYRSYAFEVLLIWLFEWMCLVR